MALSEYNPRPITHDRLIRAAKHWVLTSGKCRVAATELVAGDAYEVPDVIGWNARYWTIVVECKISRKDFRQDNKKSGRRIGAKYGLGTYRYYMTPPDLIKVEELPEGWGLLEYTPSKHARGHYIRRKVTAKEQEKAEFIIRREQEMLLSVAWRALSALELVKNLGISEEEIEETDEK